MVQAEVLWKEWFHSLHTNILRFKADDNAQSSAISLYPNPTAEQATITLNLQQAQPFTVQTFRRFRVNYIGAKAIWAIRAPMLSPSTNYRSIRRELMFYKVVTGSSINTQKLVIR